MTARPRARAWTLAAAAAAVTSCGAGGGGGGGGGGGSIPDAVTDGVGVGPCTLTLSAVPTSPVIGSDAAVRVTSTALNVTGVIDYSWQATLDGAATPFSDAEPDASAITIPLTTAGALHVQLALSNQPLCPSASADVTVLPTTGATALYRMRVATPPAVGAPIDDEIVQIHSGTVTVIPFAVPAGISLANAKVVDGTGGGVAAYARFVPAGAPTAIVEAVSSPTTGALPAMQLLGVDHMVVIEPSDPTLAPIETTWTPGGSSTFVVGAGQVITGSVLDGSGAAIAGATVTVQVADAESAPATSAADGSFSLHAATIPPSTPIAIAIVPPASSGLPRLSASVSTLSPSAAWTVRYAAAIATRDVSTMHVTRGGAAIAGAQIALVGTAPITASATITDGTANVVVDGQVRIATTTDSNGALIGPIRAPARPLSLVAITSATDVALAAIDLTTTVPASVSTSAPSLVTGTLVGAGSAGSGGAALPGAEIEATGSGALAGVTASAIADANGQFSLSLAAGGAYALRLLDPLGRAAVASSTIASAATGDLGSLALAPSVFASGVISISGSPTPPAGASVQLLCTTCDPSAPPVAEAATDANGNFMLTVPDPAAGSSSP